MSLTIYPTVNDVPAGTTIVRECDRYFERNITLKDTKEVRRLLRCIDNAVYMSPTTFRCKLFENLGDVYKGKLSTGCKSALVVALSDEDVCVNPIEIGAKALSYLITTVNHSSIVWVPRPLYMDVGSHCDVIFDGKHYDTTYNLSRAIKEY